MEPDHQPDRQRVGGLSLLNTPYGYPVLGSTTALAQGGAEAAAQLRITGPQFEENQNIYSLRQATVFDVFADSTLARGVTAFVAVENLFNTTYDVGRTPVLTTGLPRAGRVGVMIALP